MRGRENSPLSMRISTHGQARIFSLCYVIGRGISGRRIKVVLGIGVRLTDGYLFFTLPSSRPTSFDCPGGDSRSVRPADSAAHSRRFILTLPSMSDTLVLPTDFPTVEGRHSITVERFPLVPAHSLPRWRHGLSAILMYTDIEGRVKMKRRQGMSGRFGCIRRTGISSGQSTKRWGGRGG